jgi:hypothetical protein
MAEPHSTAVGTTLALGTVTLTGTILGMHYDALIVGFIAALVSLLHLPPAAGETRTIGRVFALVASASFMAGLLAPITAAAATNYLPWTLRIGADLLRVTAAALIGAGIHVAVPATMSWMRKRAGGLPE